MAVAWTEARREAYRRAALERKPWKKSTGPKSAEGKRKVSQNARRHGLKSAEVLERRRYIRSVTALLKLL